MPHITKQYPLPSWWLHKYHSRSQSNQSKRRNQFHTYRAAVRTAIQTSQNDCHKSSLTATTIVKGPCKKIPDAGLKLKVIMRLLLLQNHSKCDWRAMKLYPNLWMCRPTNAQQNPQMWTKIHKYKQLSTNGAAQHPVCHCMAGYADEASDEYGLSKNKFILWDWRRSIRRHGIE